MRTSLHSLKWGLFNLLEGDFISQYAKLYGEWSEVEVQFFRGLLSNCSNVIEVGSNIGMHAIPIAKKIPQGKLFCFEPQRIIFQLLCSNVALNHLSNVYAYNQGVGDKAAEIEISSSNYDAEWNYGSFSIVQGFNTEGNFAGQIHKEYRQIICLDTHAEIQKLSELSLLKIDAEGFELKVLKGAVETIQRHHPVVFVEAHIEQSSSLVTYLNALDYDCYWFISDRYQAKNYFNQPQSLSGLDYNLVCFHRSQTVPDILNEHFLATPNDQDREVPVLSLKE